MENTPPPQCCNETKKPSAYGVKAALQWTINGTAPRTSFQDNLSYITFLFSEWPIKDVRS